MENLISMEMDAVSHQYGSRPRTIIEMNGHDEGNRNYDTAKKFDVNFSLFLAQGDHSRYHELFVRKDIWRISWVQIGVASIICGIQIIAMCPWSRMTSLENSGMAIWSSMVTLGGAIFCLWTCKKVTFIKLNCCHILHTLAMIGSVTLFILGLLNYSKPLPKNGAVYGDHGHEEGMDPLSAMMASLIRTILMIFGAFFQAILSLFVVLRAELAICSRSCQIGFNTNRVDLKDSVYTISTNEEDELPPPYDSVVF